MLLQRLGLRVPEPLEDTIGILVVAGGLGFVRQERLGQADAMACAQHLIDPAQEADGGGEGHDARSTPPRPTPLEGSTISRVAGLRIVAGAQHRLDDQDDLQAAVAFDNVDRPVDALAEAAADRRLVKARPQAAGIERRNLDEAAGLTAAGDY